MPQCTVSSDFGPSSLVNISGTTISEGFSGLTLTAKTTLTITCGTATATLDVFPAGIVVPPVITVGAKATESGTADNLTLTITMTPHAVDQGATARVWIAARVPGTGSNPAVWIFRTATDWKLIDGPFLENFKFTTITNLQESNQMVLPIGFGKADLQRNLVEIYMGYQSGSGDFKSMGRVWK